MSKTFRSIAYNIRSDEQPAENGYEAILEQARAFISREHADNLAAAIADETAASTVRRLISVFVDEQHLYVPGLEMNQLVDQLYGDMAGFGFLDKYIYNPDIEEINGNSWNDIELITAEGVFKIDEHFSSPQRAVDTIRKMARLGGLILDHTSPAVDSYLTRGIRISALIPPLVDMDVGAVFSLRRQRMARVTQQQLVSWGTATDEMLEFLANCANYGVSIGVAGKTGSGKTTDISYLLGSLHHGKRIFTIEETRELDLVQTDQDGKVLNRVIHTCTRPSGQAGLDVDASTLLRKALRFHPDIIVPAEMRGAEAMIAQEAARTGHTVITSLHANSARMAYKRILSMCQMSDTKILTHVLMGMIVEGFPIMVFKKQLPDGKRRIMEIVEATGTWDGDVQATTLFRFAMQPDGTGQFVRVHGISDNLADTLLENGADPKWVEHCRRDPICIYPRSTKGGYSMTFNTGISTVLIIAGLFLIFKISPQGLIEILFQPVLIKLDNQTKIHAITGKKPSLLQHQLQDSRQMLAAAGMGEQLNTYRWLSLVLASLGIAFGYLIDNLLVAGVLAVGLAIAPQAIIQIRTGDYLRGLHEKLEIGMGIVTNSYLQSGDLVGTVQDSHHLLPAQLEGIFKSFLVETQFIDANLVRALEQMRGKVENYYWQEWCSVLIQCQHDRQLRFALPGIVDRLSETRRIQLEIDTTIRKHFGDYIITVMIVLGSIPLMGLMMPEWYEMLMETVAGKITLAVVLAAILFTAIWVARINRPMNMEKGGELG